MNKLLLIIPLVLISVIIVMPAEESDAATCIGTYSYPDDNVSTSAQAYDRIYFANLTSMPNVVNNDVYYLVVGGQVAFNSSNGVTATLSQNDLGLSIQQYAGGDGTYINSGSVQAIGSSVITITNGTTTRTITITTVSDTTRYLTAVDFEVTPESPIVGQPVTITPVFTPSNATYLGIDQWNVAPFSDVEITEDTDDSFTFIPLTDGNFTITAFTREGHVCSCNHNSDLDMQTFTVTAGESPTITLSDPGDVEVGDFFTVNATVSGLEASDLDWSVTEGSDLIGTLGVTSGGRQAYATTLAPGTVTIRAQSSTYPSVYDTVTFEIVGSIVRLSGPESVAVGEGFTIVGEVFGGLGVSDMELTVTAGEDLISPLSGIQLSWTGTALAPGEVTFRLEDKGDSSNYATWTMTITGDAISISLSDPGDVDVGDVFTVTATISGIDGSDLEWSVTQGSDLVGTLRTASGGKQAYAPTMAPGTVTIRAQSSTYPSVYDTVTFEIVGSIVRLSGPESVAVGEGFTIVGEVFGGLGVSDMELTVTAGEDLISPLSGIQLSWTGTALAPGEVTFRLEDKGDSSNYATWTMTITGDAISISLSDPGDVDVGDVFTVTATISGIDGSDLEWSVTQGSDLVGTLRTASGGRQAYAPTMAPGTVTIRAQSSTYPSVYDTVTFEIVGSIVRLSGPESVAVGEGFTIVGEVFGGLGVSDMELTVTAGEDLISPLSGIQLTWTGTALAPGEVTFRLEDKGDSSNYATWTMTIEGPPSILPTSISITGPGAVAPGDKGEIYANIIPTNAPNRGIIWSVTDGVNRIEYTTSSTYRGGVLEFTALYPGTVTITATSTADESVRGSYTLTIITEDEGDGEIIDLDGATTILGMGLFDGKTDIAGIVIYAIIILGVFALFREPLPVLIISMPVTLIFTGLGILSTNLMIILIIAAVLGLALIARNMWRD